MIRHASIEEKRKTFEWLCLSDTTSMCMGPPDYPEHPVPTWEEFQDDFDDFYYSRIGRHKGSVMIIEDSGVEIGCICYACFHLKPQIAELDLWFNAKIYCGKGYGPQAIQELIEYLNDSLAIHTFIIRPSEKNLRAIKAYKKAGFQKIQDKEEILRQYLNDLHGKAYFDGDYGFKETALFLRKL